MDGAGAECVSVLQPTSPQPGYLAKGSPVDQVMAHAPVRARLALALVHIQLAASTSVTWSAHAAVGAHAVQARTSVQAGRRQALVHLVLTGYAWTGAGDMGIKSRGAIGAQPAVPNLLQLPRCQWFPHSKEVMLDKHKRTLLAISLTAG